MPQMIRVRVHPGASKDRCHLVAPDRYEVWVRAKPIDGRATQAVVEVLSRTLGVPVTRVRIRRGAQSRTKLFEVI